MSTDSGWWSKRLGQPAPPPQNYAPQGYVPQAPPPTQYPQGQQAYPQQHTPQQIQVTPENLYEAAQLWQGGEATKNETQPCPKCGSPHFFSRTGTLNSRGPAPAPICYTCGFNGLFDQADPGNWQAN